MNGRLWSEIDDLERLERGWHDTDGIAGEPPRANAVAGARRIGAVCALHELPMPHAFPTVEGGISLEWSFDGIEASIRFHDSGKTATVASLDTATGEHRFEDNADVDNQYVKDWLGQLGDSTHSA